MIKIMGKDLWREGEKIGYVEGHHVYNHEGHRLGYFTDHHVWNMRDDKLAYVEDDHLYAEEGDSKTSLEDVAQDVQGGVLPIIEKCAIYILLGS